MAVTYRTVPTLNCLSNGKFPRETAYFLGLRKSMESLVPRFRCWITNPDLTTLNIPMEPFTISYSARRLQARRRVESFFSYRSQTKFVKLNGTELACPWTAWEDDWVRDRSNPSYTEAPDFGTFKTGKISLQDHGDVVYYRNIKIREL